MTKMKGMLNFGSYFAVLICLLSIVQKVYSFGPITHFHINREANPGLGKIFETYATIPDMLYVPPLISFENPYILETIFGADAVHSPSSKETPFSSGSCPFLNKQNFGYLLFRVANSNNKINASRGLGGHIAADWVAHEVLLVTDVPGLQGLFDAISNIIEHIATEVVIDYYVYLTKGEVNLADNYYPLLIRKGLINYFLIDNHEYDFVNGFAEDDVRDFLQRDAAINLADNTMPSDEILNKMKAFVALVNLEQNEFLRIKRDGDQNNFNQSFIAQYSSIADPLFSAGVFSVQAWLANLVLNQSFSARGVPQQYMNSVCSSSSMLSLSSSTGGSKTLSLREKALQLNPTQINSNNINVTDIHEIFYSFLNEATQKALQEGVMTEEVTNIIDNEGQDAVKINVQVLNETRVSEIFNETIQNHIQNPLDVLDLRLAKWLKRVFIDHNLNVAEILDFTIPTAEITSPTDGQSVSGVLSITGTASDANFVSYKVEIGQGDNPATFNTVQSSTTPVNNDLLATLDTGTLASGIYILRLSVLDKNDNENMARVKINVGGVVVTPEDMIKAQIQALQALKQEIQSLSLTNEQGFIAKIDATVANLNKALDSLKAGNVKEAQNTINAGVNELNALANLINAQEDKKLTKAEKDKFLAETTAIVDSLQKIKLTSSALTKEESQSVEDGVGLLKNIGVYPNPSRDGKINFSYKLTQKGKQKAKQGELTVRIEVYTISGKKVTELVCNALDENCRWQDSLANGVYVYRMIITDVDGSKESKVGKIVVIK